ncbi:MAG: hypothetical protein ACK4KT_09150 [Thermaurantimonas sp.]
MLTALLSVLISSGLFSQRVSYIEFPEYGFKHKFPIGYATHSSPKGDLNAQFIKGYNYVRRNGDQLVDIVLEVYKGGCYDPEEVRRYCETSLKGDKNSSLTFSDVKSDLYLSPFGWLVFKGTARNFDNVNMYHFFNLYISNDYMVVVRSFMVRDQFWEVGYGTVADNSDGLSFVEMPIERTLKELGISINVQGFYNQNFTTGDIPAFSYYRCADSDNLPYFKIFLFEGEVKKRYDLRTLQFLQHKDELLEFNLRDIPWSSAGARKFTNSKKSLKKFIYTSENGTTYPLYETYYMFDFNGKSYIVLLNVPIRPDSILRGYQTANYDAEYIGREIFMMYEENLIKILESIH